MAADLPIASISPPASLAGLGRAPLIPGDDTAGYEALLAGISAVVRPRDVLEHGWVREVADLLFERGRLRRLKAALMTAYADEGMAKLLMGLGEPNFFTLSKRWAARELAAVGRVEAILDAAGLGIDHVMAQTLRVAIGESERIERMVASVEARRAAILREIEHYRAHFGADLRRAAADAATIQDAEFEVVAPPVVPGPAAQSAEAAAAEAAA
jgi:hypothetical protein